MSLGTDEAPGSGRPGEAAGHGHHHDPGELPPATRRTRRLIAGILLPVAVLTLAALALLWPVGGQAPPPAQPVDQRTVRALGTVTAVAERPCPPGETPPTRGWVRRCGDARVIVTEGPGTGQEVTIDLPQGSAAVSLGTGDDVVLSYFTDAAAGEPAYAYSDRQRGRPMLWLAALAVAVILAFGRWRGVTSLLGLAVSFAILLLFVIPAILAGQPPLLVAVVGAAAIMFAALYLTHGVNVHTSVAVLGTLASLVITGLLGAGFTALTALTGASGEDTTYLATMGVDVDLRGLLLAGIVIGSLGVLDDVTVTQAVTVAELAGGAPTSRLRLFEAAIRIGRAHVASAVNTIVLAYAGTALPLLLVVAAGPQGLTEVLTNQFIAQEVVRSAVGTVGLVASVPITTALAVLVADVRGPRSGAVRPPGPAA